VCIGTRWIFSHATARPGRTNFAGQPGSALRGVGGWVTYRHVGHEEFRNMMFSRLADQLADKWSPFLTPTTATCCWCLRRLSLRVNRALSSRMGRSRRDASSVEEVTVTVTKATPAAVRQGDEDLLMLQKQNPSPVAEPEPGRPAWDREEWLGTKPSLSSGALWERLNPRSRGQIADR